MLDSRAKRIQHVELTILMATSNSFDFLAQQSAIKFRVDLPNNVEFCVFIWPQALSDYLQTSECRRANEIKPANN